MTKNKLENLLHWIIVICTFGSIGIYFVTNLSSPEDSGTQCFKYFTTDSNVLACIASLFCIIFTRKGNRPKWVSVLQFIGTVSVSGTFVIVVIFLAPMSAIFGNGIASALTFFQGNGFILHFTTPVLSIIALMLSNEKYSKSICYYSVIPFFIYSIVYLITVVFIKCWDDIYGFTFGGHFELAPIPMLVIYTIAFLIALAEWKAHSSILKHAEEKIQ